MSTKEQPPPPPPKLVKLNKAFKLAEQWVNNMTGDVEETGEMEMEGRPFRLGLGAKVPRKSQVGTPNDPIGRKLHKKLGIGTSKATSDEGSTPSAKNELEYESDDGENLESRANAFVKKRAAPLTTTPLTKKKPK